MKRYCFYGNMPKDTIAEESLTQEQKKIIELEKEKISKDNFDKSWIGMKKNEGWDFMRHGFEVIHINEARGNIAREQLQSIIKEKYYSDN